MKALVYTGTNASELRDVEAPIAAAGQSIVDLSFCGICGSDMHAWHGHDSAVSRLSFWDMRQSARRSPDRSPDGGWQSIRS